jgi:hypothetical protein
MKKTANQNADVSGSDAFELEDESYDELPTLREC